MVARSVVGMGRPITCSRMLLVLLAWWHGHRSSLHEGGEGMGILHVTQCARRP